MEYRYIGGKPRTDIGEFLIDGEKIYVKKNGVYEAVCVFCVNFRGRINVFVWCEPINITYISKSPTSTAEYFIHYDSLSGNEYLYVKRDNQYIKFKTLFNI